jgi:succinate dehydrogenase / fumarate reductase flavoprotein subunit
MGDAVVLATGGCGIVFGRSTLSVICTGTAASAVYQQGAVYANGECIQVHPTAIPGADKLRLISESARGEGGRVWVPKDKGERRDPRDVPEKERDYFLERMYPGYGNLVPRDIASRALFKTCYHEGRGVFSAEDGQERERGLSRPHPQERVLPAEQARRYPGDLREVRRRRPVQEPDEGLPRRPLFDGRPLGRLRGDARGSLKAGSPRNHSTNIPGLYAVGEVDYQYHGANRLGANSLLSCIYGGMVTGPAVATYQKNLQKSAFDLPKSTFDKAEKKAQDDYERILKQNQTAKNAENAYVLHAELGELMLRDCTIERDNKVLDKLLGNLGEMDERVKRVKSTDLSPRVNQGAQFVRHLENMLVLARVIAQGARNRDESRGAHYKPDFSKRNDAEWLRTTMAVHEQKGAVKYVRELDYASAGRASTSPTPWT